MNRRIHYLEGWPSTAGIEPDPEILCGDPDPYDYNTDEGFVTCPDCLLILGARKYGPGPECTDLVEIEAGIQRSHELEAWLADLQARGQARVIRVRDLGPALEAREKGVKLIEFVTRSLHHVSPLHPWTLPVRSYWQTADAARLARRSLEVSP